MGYIVRMPKLGLEMDEGTLLDWYVSENGTIEAEEAVAEIESEKTTAEVDAREGGVLRRVFLDEGETVDPGTPIGIIAGADEDISALIDEAETELEDGAATASEEDETSAEPAAQTSAESETTKNSSSGTSDASPRARKRAEELDVDLGAVSGSGPTGAITAEDVEAAAESGTDDVKASPRAKKRADELDVDLTAVSGSGPGGAITAEDVETAADSTGSSGGGAARTLSEERTFGGMRQSIADRLGQSYREAVHVTEHREIDVEELLAAVDAAEDALDVDVSMSDVLLVALSAALEDHPEFNATFEDGTHRLYEEHNICVAVDVDEGLVTPVVPAVDSKSLGELAEARRGVTQRTLDGEYTMSDLRGGTFTVTNLGVLGVESFNPIINPPQIAILGVNAVDERVVLQDDGTPETRRVLPLDLSFDHRVVDGADAARFLQSLVGHLEDPWPLLPDEVSPVAAEEYPGRHATATSRDGMSGTVRTTGVEQQYSADEGTPSPVELFLSSLSACLSLSIRYQADVRDLDVARIDVTADAEPDSGSVEAIEVAVDIDAPDVDEETLDRIVENGERSCHVAELLDADLPMSLSWERT